MNPLLGRWISADPLAVHAPGEADLNLYAYVKGYVLKSVDPLGLSDIDTKQVLRDFGNALPGRAGLPNDRGHNSLRGLRGMMHIVADKLRAANDYRLTAQRGSYDETTKSLYMERQAWKDAREFSLTQFLPKEKAQPFLNFKMTVHEAFHAYEDLHLSQDSTYLSKETAAIGRYAAAHKLDHVAASRLAKEAHAEYVATRATVYTLTQQELRDAWGKGELTAARLESIKSTFEKSMASAEASGYYQTAAEGRESDTTTHEQVPVTVTLSSEMKQELDGISGIQNNFEDNAAFRHFKPNAAEGD